MIFPDRLLEILRLGAKSRSKEAVGLYMRLAHKIALKWWVAAMLVRFWRSGLG